MSISEGVSYPVCGVLPYADCVKLWGEETWRGMNLKARMIARHNLRARYSGEFRPPRAGEWYLSGATIGAFRALNNLSTPFHIARIQLVKFSKITYTEVISEI